MSQQRERLASRIGFIFLSAGCAIGLGNVWRFPFITGQYGGAAFVLIYILFLLIFGLPIMVMEFAIGRASSRTSLAMKNIATKGTKWHVYGPIAIGGKLCTDDFYTTSAVGCSPTCGPWPRSVRRTHSRPSGSILRRHARQRRHDASGWFLPHSRTGNRGMGLQKESRRHQVT